MTFYRNIVVLIFGGLFACKTTRIDSSQEKGTVIARHEDQAAVIYPVVTKGAYGQSSYYVCYRKCHGIAGVSDVEALKHCPSSDLHGDTLNNIIGSYPALSNVLIGDGLVVYSNFDNVNDDLGSDLVRKFFELRRRPVLQSGSPGYVACNSGSGAVTAPKYPRCWRAASETGWIHPSNGRTYHVVVYVSERPGQMKMDAYFGYGSESYTDKGWDEAAAHIENLTKGGKCNAILSDSVSGLNLPIQD